MPLPADRNDRRLAVKAAAFRATPADLASPANLAALDAPAFLVHLASPVVHHQFATSQRSPHAETVHLDNPATPALLESLEILAHLASPVVQATMDHQALLDHRDPLVHLAIQVATDHVETQAGQPSRRLLYPAIPDSLANPDHLVFLVTLASLVVTVSLVHLVTAAHPDHLVHQARLASPVILDQKARPDSRASVVSARNTARWTAVYSSRTAHEESKRCTRVGGNRMHRRCSCWLVGRSVL